MPNLMFMLQVKLFSIIHIEWIKGQDHLEDLDIDKEIQIKEIFCWGKDWIHFVWERVL